MQTRDLRVNLGRKEILHGLSLAIPQGQIVVLLGKNGSGKTTLLKALAGLLKPKTGAVEFPDEPWAEGGRKERAKHVGYLPQRLPVPAISVKQLVSFGRYPYSSWLSTISKEDEELALQAIQRMGIESKANALVCHLSGGERSMAYMALILAQNTEYLLLDEPFSSLDEQSKEKLKAILREEKSKGKTILLSVHDLLLAYDLADELLLLDQGKCLFAGNKADFLAQKTYIPIFGHEIVPTKDAKGNEYWSLALSQEENSNEN